MMPTRSDIAAAAFRISGYVRHTPLLHVAPGELGCPAPVTMKLNFCNTLAVSNREAHSTDC